ncbi:Spore germination protein [[Clostridium] ultunense Esp]|nr:Spore germination protein [[Clostridium] ultunense Esp]
MERRKEITPFQVGNILISSIIGPGLLPFPRYVAEVAGTAAPLVTLLGMSITLVGVLAVAFLNIHYPGLTFFRYSERIIGRWIAFPLNLLIIFIFLFLTAFMAREFGKVVVTSVLENTPVEASLIIMLLMASLSSRHDFTTFSYIHQFYTPLILFPVLFPVLLLVPLSLGNMNPLYLQPILGDGSQRFIEGGITVAGFFQEFFILSILTRSVQKIGRIPITAFWGMLVVGGIYFMVGTVSLAVFGPEALKELLWPTLELAKLTILPGQILERFDGAFLAVWVVATFTSLLSSYYLAVHGTTDIFRLRDHKAVGLFYLPYVYLLAIVPKNVFSLYDFINIVVRAGLLLTILYPLVLLGIVLLRKKGGRKGGKGKEKEEAPKPASLS